MLDLPDRSVLVLGLDQWEMQGKGAFQKIEEPRLQRLLHLRLKDDDRIVGDKPPELPDAADQQAAIPRSPSPAVRATVFPRWFACDAMPGDMPNRRRLVRFQDLDPPKRVRSHRPRRQEAKGLADPLCVRLRERPSARHRLAPRGPSEVARRGGGRGRSAGACRKPMWLEDFGTSADPRDTRIVCECGASLSLEELFQPGRLGAAPANGRGSRSTIGSRTAATKGCGFLTRSATNTYFPQIARVISLPQAVDALARSLEAVWTDISECKTRR